MTDLQVAEKRPSQTLSGDFQFKGSASGSGPRIRSTEAGRGQARSMSNGKKGADMSSRAFAMHPHPSDDGGVEDEGGWLWPGP